MRTTFLVFALLVGTPSALADIVIAPPALQIVGVDRSIAEGAPTQATYRLENTTDEELSVWIHRVVLLDGRMRVPITPSQVTVDGRTVGRTLNVPANGSLTVTVTFAATPAMERLRTWRLELNVTNDGGNLPGVATIRRSRD